MKSKQKNRLIILIMVTILLIILIGLISMQIYLNTVQNDSDVNVSIQENTKEVTTVQEIIEKNDSVYIKEDTKGIPNIYANFKYDLYDENGNSNENFFNKIIEEIVELKQSSFQLTDEEKNIKIQVTYDRKTQRYSIKINNEDNYYRVTNGNMYVQIQETSIAGKQKMEIESPELRSLVSKSMYYARIDFGEIIELEDGYNLCKEGTIKIRTFKGTVRNIIFLEGYEEEVVKGVKVGTPLKDIYEQYEDVAFGSVREGYLGYRTGDIYIFFYEDEISIYGYAYAENPEFEEELEEYLNTKYLDKFVDNITKKWKNYDLFEYDSENMNVHIVYPSRGVEINIKNNDPKGIIFYNNYYLTDKTKGFIRDNKVTLNPSDDYLHITEQNRRNNSN